MSADQPTAEFTTRDVLVQVDRRVSLIETDVRELREQVDARFDASRREVNGQFGETRHEASQEFARVRTEAASFRKEMVEQFAAVRAEANARWRWTIGLILASWLSIMGTNLLR